MPERNPVQPSIGEGMAQSAFRRGLIKELEEAMDLAIEMAGAGHNVSERREGLSVLKVEVLAEMEAWGNVKRLVRASDGGKK